MKKFKAGDKAKRLYNAIGFTKGKTYRVLEYNTWGDGRLYVTDDHGKLRQFFPGDYEKVEEYEVGKPYLWFGGECPLPKGTSVAFRFGSGDFSYIDENWTHEECAKDVNWEHEFTVDNVLMFKVVEYPKATRKVEMELTEEEITTIKEVLGKVNL